LSLLRVFLVRVIGRDRFAMPAAHVPKNQKSLEALRHFFWETAKFARLIVAFEKPAFTPDS
jgi:hypothetical protein